MKKSFTKLLASVLAVGLAMTAFAGCNKATRKPSVHDNETEPLVFSSQDVDNVFNPFFSTAAADSNVIGPTQIGMINNDKNGNPVYGDDEEVVVKDMSEKTVGEKREQGDWQEGDQTTEYLFVLKNNIKFSNGTPLTMKDVLFNFYVLLDPAYNGSSTVYSTEIVGLTEYRTQTSNRKEQEDFMVRFDNEAQERIEALVGAKAEIFEMFDDDLGSDPAAKFVEELAKLQESSPEIYPHLVEDYQKALELFREELKTDYNSGLDSYIDTVFKDDKGIEHKELLKSDVETFLYNEGYIEWNKKENGGNGELIYNVSKSDLAQWNEWALSTTPADRNKARDAATEFVFNAKIPNDIDEIVQYWATSADLFDYLSKAAMEAYYQEHPEREFKNISGIKFANRTDPVTVNGVEYGVPEYNTDGSPKAGSYEVLSITIKNVDPKAIWNFSISVAPMYYYSNQTQIDLFDYEEHFGVEWGSQSFMEDVINAPNKVGLPVGAGPYAASRASGGINTDSAGDFADNNIIYYERNPYYFADNWDGQKPIDPTKPHPALIKKMRYQVTPENQMVNSLFNGTLSFIEPNAKPETKAEIDAKKDDGYVAKSVQTAGYGYIGVNAGKVPSLGVRQAIMHCINTQECVNYYKGQASVLTRSMSKSSWAYTDGKLGDKTAYYPYIAGPIPENLDVVNPDYSAFIMGKRAKPSEGRTAADYATGKILSAADQEEFIRGLVEDEGYTLGADGVYVNTRGQRLKYDFVVVGETTDHPAWLALYHAEELLDRWGFNITTKTDRDGLTKLGTGSLAVWAAAWGSTIDPDMYQVYHKESNASSVLNWGYREIKLNTGDRYYRENIIVNDLSDLIDRAREVTDHKQRADFYAQALDLVMQLAVELPTYQRDDLFAYDAYKLDPASLTPDGDLTSYMGLTSHMYRTSLVTALAQ